MTRHIELMILAVLCFARVGLGDGADFPRFARVQSAAQAHLRDARRRPADLISQGDAKALMEAISELGWDIEDQDAIVALTLPDGHGLVKTLRTKRGQEFMRRVAGYKLIYDRLERITGVPGGQRMFNDLVRLPDGHRYAKQTTVGAVPDLLALLPKTGNGKKRRIRDYDQPTGNLYTMTAVLARIQESYERATQ